MLLLVNPFSKWAPDADLTIQLSDLFEVFLGVVDNPRYNYKGSEGENIVLVRLSSIDINTYKIKSIQELIAKEKEVGEKRKLTKEKGKELSFKKLKNRKLSLKKNDLLLPIKGKTQVIFFDQELDHSSPVLLVPSQHFLLLRKRGVHTNFLTPYLLLVVKLLLEKIGNERYLERVDEVKGEYGRFNTFTKKEVEALSIKLHSNTKFQQIIFDNNKELSDIADEALQAQKRVYQDLLNQLEPGK